MKRIALVIMAVAGLSVTGASLASEELAKKSGCLNCHNVTGAKKMAPALKDFAPKGEEAILAALKDPKGKHGSVKASDEDKAALAKWVAGMK